jgi:hypothetical protein
MDPRNAIRVLASTPAKVNALVAPLTESQLRWRPAPGEWSIKEVLCHLRDTARLHGERMRRVATEENPPLPSWDEQAAARDLKYQDDVTEAILPAYVDLRAATVELLNGLGEDAWQRPGVHAESGPLTLQSLLESSANHDREHLAQLRALKAGALAANP